MNWPESPDMDDLDHQASWLVYVFAAALTESRRLLVSQIPRH